MKVGTVTASLADVTQLSLIGLFVHLDSAAHSAGYSAGMLRFADVGEMRVKHAIFQQVKHLIVKPFSLNASNLVPTLLVTMHRSVIWSCRVALLFFCCYFALLDAVSVQSPRAHASVTPVHKARLSSPSLLLVSTISGDTHVLRARDGSGACHPQLSHILQLLPDTAAAHSRDVDTSRRESFGVNFSARKFLWIQAGACSGWFVSRIICASFFYFEFLGNLFRVDGDRGLVERLPRSVQVFMN